MHNLSTRKTVTLLSSLLVITIPLSLIIWLLFFFDLNNHQNVSPIRIFNCLFIPMVMSIYGLKRESVDLFGAITGCVFGIIFIISNYAFLFSLLIIFYVIGKVTKYKAEIKSKFEEDYNKSSKRNWIQIVCNLGIAAQLTIFYLIESGPAAELPLNFQHNFTCSCLIVAILGSFSCCFADTLASELGTVLSYDDPRLITTLRKVPKGTNGGISLIGFIFSLLGGLLVGLCFLTSLYIFIDEKKVVTIYPQWPILLITSLSGLYGSILDSYLGALFQYSGINTKTGKIANRPGPGVRKISGLNFLDNHLVNFLSTLITPVFSIIISIYIYQYLVIKS